MLATYLGVSGGIFFVAWLVRAALRKLKFEAFDRHLGMILGGMEGGLIGIVTTLFVVSLAPQTRGPIFASPAGKIVGQVMAAVGPVLPQEARDVLQPFWTGASGSAGTNVAADQPSPADRPVAQTAARPLRTIRDGGHDQAVAPTSLRSLIQQEEKKLTQEIADEAAKSLDQVSGGSAGGNDTGTVERR
jgi:membrane protein required for colicin V production